MNNKIIAGLVLLAVGIWAVSFWWWQIIDIIKGLFAILLLLAGIFLIGIGVRNNTHTSEHAETNNKVK